MKQRLAERKRRSSLRDNSDTISCGLSSLKPFSGDISLVAVHQPVLISSGSSTSAKQYKPLLISSATNASSQKFNFQSTEDTSSQNKSTATQGGSLATRLSLLVTRISSATYRVNYSDDDVADLNSLISEVNQIEQLSLKHSTVNKICKLLCESNVKETLAQKVNDSKQQSTLAFKSKMKLELKGMQVDDSIVQIITKA